MYQHRIVEEAKSVGGDEASAEEEYLETSETMTLDKMTLFHRTDNGTLRIAACTFILCFGIFGYIV